MLWCQERKKGDACEAVAVSICSWGHKFLHGRLLLGHRFRGAALRSLVTCCPGGSDCPALLLKVVHSWEWARQHAKSCPLKIVCSYCCSKSNLNHEFIFWFLLRVLGKNWELLFCCLMQLDNLLPGRCLFNMNGDAFIQTTPLRSKDTHRFEIKIS